MKCQYPQRKTETNSDIDYQYEHRCGQCMPCRITKAQERATRIFLEGQQHEGASAFVTFTYSDEHKPQNGSISKEAPRALRKSIKKLALNSQLKIEKVRFYTIGEYGDESLRPHYHIAIFGIPLDINYQERETKSQKSYREIMHKRRNDYVEFQGFERLMLRAWSYKGHVDIKSLDTGLSQYMTNYITKGMSNAKQLPEGLTPEFASMSNNPGIGRDACYEIADLMMQRKYYPYQYENMRKDSTWKPINWSHLVRYDGKTRPLDAYMRKNIIQIMGGDGRTDQRKLLTMEMRSTTKPNQEKLKHGEYLLEFQSSEKQKNLNKIARWKKCRNDPNKTRL